MLVSVRKSYTDWMGYLFSSCFVISNKRRSFQGSLNVTVSDEDHLATRRKMCHFNTLQNYIIVLLFSVCSAVTCPTGFTYQSSASACPATCSNPTAPSSCSRPNTETCICSGNTLLSNGCCVSACPCVDQTGIIHQVICCLFIVFVEC